MAKKYSPQLGRKLGIFFHRKSHFEIICGKIDTICALATNRIHSAAVLTNLRGFVIWNRSALPCPLANEISSLATAIVYPRYNIEKNERKTTAANHAHR